MAGVQSLGREDPIEEGMAVHSSILAWRIPWTEEPRGAQSRGHKELYMTEATQHVHTRAHTQHSMLAKFSIVKTHFYKEKEYV